MNQQAAIIARPELTMPAQEADLLRGHYAAATSILEYGAGGSTVMASEMAGKHIISVETDQRWVEDMQAYFDLNPGQSPVDLIWANIGKTRKWGRPKDDSQWRDFARYPLEIWDLEGVPHPDVVLVDGRFRAGCVLAAAYRCRQPVTVLVDDYKPRPSYHRVEAYVGKPELTGRMAVFEITPTPFPVERLLDIIFMLQDPY